MKSKKYLFITLLLHYSETNEIKVWKSFVQHITQNERISIKIKIELVVGISNWEITT